MNNPRRKRSIEELRQEVDRRAVAQLEELLKPDAVEKTIREIFDDRIESVVCSALGFEHDDYADGGWELKTYQRDNEVHAIYKLISETAQNIAKQMFPMLLEEATKSFNLEPLLLKKTRSIAKSLFKDKCYHELNELLSEEINKRAENTVAEVLKEKFEIRFAADLRTDEEKKRDRMK